MLHRFILAAAIAAGVTSVAPAQAQAPSTTQGPVSLQPGQRFALGSMMGERVLREIMVGRDGNSVLLMYDMPPGTPQSRRVLRLENVNGMLEVVYDTAAPTMNLGAGGAPRLVPTGGGMYTVEYGPAR